MTQPTLTLTPELYEVAVQMAAARLAAGETVEPPGFEAWLFGKARTEQGPFPDWEYVRTFAQHLVSGEPIIVLKRRQALFSWVMAAYTHWQSAYHPYTHSAVASAGEREAKAQARRILTVAMHDGIALGEGTELLRYPNGSDVAVYPATAHAGVGSSLNGVVHLDEWALHPYAQSNLDTLLPALANSGGQLVITSTSHPGPGSASGAFKAFWEGKSQARRLFYGRYVRPDQPAGAAFWATQREEHTAEAFAAYYPETEEEAWTSSSGLVFGLDADGERFFDPKRNVCEPEVAWEQAPWRVIGYDPGGTSDPAGLVAVGVWPANPIGGNAARIRGLWRHHVYGATRVGTGLNAFQVRDYRRKLDAQYVYLGETGGSTISETLNAADPRAPAIYHRPAMDRFEGIEHLKYLLKSGLLTVSPELAALIEEFGSYWWKPRREMESGNARADTLVPGSKHHADLIDALRYACMGILAGLPGVPNVVRQAGRSGSVLVQPTRGGWR